MGYICQFSPYSSKKILKFYVSILHSIVAETFTFVPSSTLPVINYPLYSDSIF